jgi:hypothetical protein
MMLASSGVNGLVFAMIVGVPMVLAWVLVVANISAVTATSG